MTDLKTKDTETDVDIPLVYITWKDHFSLIDDWTSFEDIKAQPVALIIETVGFLVDEGDDYYRVGYNIAENGKISGCITILKGCVISKKEVKIA